MLRQRVVTALIMLPIFLLGLFATNPLGFAWFTAAVVAIGAWEWARLGGLTRHWQRGLYVGVTLGSLLLLKDLQMGSLLLAFIGWCMALVLIFTWPRGRGAWSLPVLRLGVGLLLLHAVWTALQGLRLSTWAPQSELDPRLLILFVFLVVWAADIGAYFAGRRFGRRKLAPAVSPGKSVEGVIGGALAASLLVLVAAPPMGLQGMQWALLWGVTLLTALFSVVGDLLESLAKRSVDVKDSGRLLPGHGGVMDRIDSLCASIPVFAFLTASLGWLQLSGSAH